ncbi:MAG TPA: hypothetical protein VKA53_00875 [Thermoanaerobaculia bacterium]|nr:hypothetical protein [Thermoanaerobaculia bacterium]
MSLGQSAVGWFLYAIDQRRLHRARKNLGQVRPRLDSRQRRKIVRGAYLEFRRHQIALPTLARMSSVSLCERLSLNDWGQLHRARAARPGRGVVILGLTLGFFPLLQRALELYCAPIIVLRGPLELESEAGGRILAHLGAGGNILAPCGFPTMAESAARIAVAAEAHTIPALAATSGRNFHVTLLAPLAPGPALAERYRSLLAAEIDRAPEAWPWHLAAPDIAPTPGDEI